MYAHGGEPGDKAKYLYLSVIVLRLLRRHCIIPIQRWYVNGEVMCFTGSHIALAALSGLTLLVAIALIPFLLLLSVGHVQRVTFITVIIL